MLLALALYASTAHAASPPDSVERPASSTRTRRTTTSSCWGVKARMARGENLPSSPSDSAPLRGRGQDANRNTLRVAQGCPCTPVLGNYSLSARERSRDLE